MVTLKEKHPELDEKLEKENFVVQKTTRVFSALPIYQAYEQVNAVIKANGNIISITEDPPALRRWSVARPEVSHLVETYKAES